MKRLLNRFRNWLDSLLDMHLDFTGDLMTPASPDDPWWYERTTDWSDEDPFP